MSFEKIVILMWHLFRLAVRMFIATLLVLLHPIVYLAFGLTGRDPKDFDKFEEAFERWLYDGFRGLFHK